MTQFVQKETAEYEKRVKRYLLIQRVVMAITTVALVVGIFFVYQLRQLAEFSSESVALIDRWTNCRTEWMELGVAEFLETEKQALTAELSELELSQDTEKSTILKNRATTLLVLSELNEKFADQFLAVGDALGAAFTNLTIEHLRVADQLLKETRLTLDDLKNKLEEYKKSASP